MDYEYCYTQWSAYKKKLKALQDEGCADEEQLKEVETQIDRWYSLVRSY